VEVFILLIVHKKLVEGCIVFVNISVEQRWPFVLSFLYFSGLFRGVSASQYFFSIIWHL